MGKNSHYCGVQNDLRAHFLRLLYQLSADVDPADAGLMLL